MKKTDLPDGMFEIPEILPFYVEPDDFAWRIRDDWLNEIDGGHFPVMETIIPYLEREAVSRFKREWTVDKYDWYPDIRDGYEDWRIWWMNQARHNCDVYSPVGRANSSLTAVGQAAVNVLMAASDLRTAIEQKNAERIAALSMLLFAEALMGGYVLEHTAAQTSIHAINEARRIAYQNGIGKAAKDLDLARRATISLASKLWSGNKAMRIGEVASEVLVKLKDNKDKFSENFDFPGLEAIKAWIREAGKLGKLTIPAGAQAKGRPPKAK